MVGSPPSVTKFVGYCCGESYVDRKAYSKEMANYRAENSIMQRVIDTQLHAANQAALAPVSSGLAQNLPQPVVRFVQTLFQQFIAQPVRTFFDNVRQALPEPLQAFFAQFGQARSTTENILNKVVNFFFGQKKDRKEEKTLRDDYDMDESSKYLDAFILKAENAHNESSSH